MDWLSPRVWTVPSGPGLSTQLFALAERCLETSVSIPVARNNRPRRMCARIEGKRFRFASACTWKAATHLAAKLTKDAPCRIAVPTVRVS